MPGHDIVIVLTGCFILAFGWFGFNPGSTLAASGNGALRIASIAVNTMLAGCTGSFGAILYMWMRYGKPDASMAGNGLLAGVGGVPRPPRPLWTHRARGIRRFGRGRGLGCLLYFSSAGRVGW